MAEPRKEIKTEAARPAVVHSRQVGSVTVTVVAPLDPPVPRKPQRPPEPGRERWTVEAAEAAAEAGRARRLLRSLIAIWASRDQATFRAEQRLALLITAARLLALIDRRDGRAVDRVALKGWAKKHLSGALAAEVAAAMAEVGDDLLEAVPAPFEIGSDLALTCVHWFAAARPWGCWPADLTAAEVRFVQREAKRARDRDRAKANRAANGATPREQSLAAQARALGITAPALRKRQERGFDFVASTKEKVHTRDEIETGRRAAKAAPPSTEPAMAIPAQHWRQATIARMLAGAADAFSPGSCPVEWCSLRRWSPCSPAFAGLVSVPRLAG